MQPDEDGLLPALDPSTYQLRKEAQRRIAGGGPRITSEMIVSATTPIVPRPPAWQQSITRKQQSVVTIRYVEKADATTRRRVSVGGTMPPQMFDDDSAVLTREDPAKALLGARRSSIDVGPRRPSLTQHTPWDATTGPQRWLELHASLVPRVISECTDTLRALDTSFTLRALDSILNVAAAFEPELKPIVVDLKGRVATACGDVRYWKQRVLGDHFRSWRGSCSHKGVQQSWNSMLVRLRGELETERKAKQIQVGHVESLVAEIRRAETETKKLQKEMATKAENSRRESVVSAKSEGVLPAVVALPGDVDRLTQELRRAMISTKQTGERLREEQGVTRGLNEALHSMTADRDRLMALLEAKSASLEVLKEAVVGRLAIPANETLVRVLNSLPHLMGLGARSEEGFFVSVLKTVAGSMGGTQLVLPMMATLQDPEVNLVYYAASLHVIDPKCVDGANVVIAAKFRNVGELQSMIMGGLETLGIGGLGIEADDLLLPTAAVHYAVAGAIAALWLHNLVMRVDAFPPGKELAVVAALVPQWRTAMLNVVGITVSAALRSSRAAGREAMKGIQLEEKDAFSKLTRSDFKRDVPIDADYEEIQAMVVAQSGLLMAVFHYYGTISDPSSETPSLCMDPTGAFRLMADCRMDNKKSLTRDNVRSMMQSMASRLGVTKKDAMDLPGIAFPEVLVRCAFLRYPTNNVVSAVRHMLNGLSHSAGRVQHDLLKTTFLYDGNMREVRREITATCQQPFRDKSLRDVRMATKNVITFQMFVEIFDDLKAVDDQMSHVALAGMYVHAQDYGGDNGKPMLMTFNEFSFAFVCVALYKYPCPYWPMHLRVMKFLESCKEQGTLQGGAKSIPLYGGGGGGGVVSSNDLKVTLEKSSASVVAIDHTMTRRVSHTSEMTAMPLVKRNSKLRSPSISAAPSPITTGPEEGLFDRHDTFAYVERDAHPNATM